jgi:hypothetical protein
MALRYYYNIKPLLKSSSSPDLKPPILLSHVEARYLSLSLSRLSFSVIFCLDAQKTVEIKVKKRNGIVSQNFFGHVSELYLALFSNSLFFFFSKLLVEIGDMGFIHFFMIVYIY